MEKTSRIRLIGKGFILQQDNDPKHSSLLCRTYVERLEARKELKNMVWPPQSPDCNPIELLWDHLDRQVRKKPLTNVNALWSHLQQEWKKISEETLVHLIDRMPRVCKAVIKARGAYFEESKI